METAHKGKNLLIEEQNNFLQELTPTEMEDKKKVELV